MQEKKSTLKKRNNELGADIAFGKVLREARQTRGMSQEHLAQESDLDRTFISLLERGLRQPSLSTILQIAQTLQLPPAKLIQAVVDKLDEDSSD
jgi:transcriptional regulator with XRE-family HTH domain